MLIRWSRTVLESLAGDSTEELCSDEALRLKDSEENQNLPPLPIGVRGSCLGLYFPERSCLALSNS